LFLNYSNPESRIILALGKYSKISAVGLCHGVYMGRNDVAQIMGRDAHQTSVWAAGLNHFQWLLEIRAKETGEDLYPLLREKEWGYDPAFMPLTRRLFRAFGKWPTCSDDHMGEYVAYGWEGGEEGYNYEWDESRRAQLREQVDEVLSGRAPLPNDWTQPDEENAVKIITGVLQNRAAFVEAGVVYNQGAIANLPPDLAVEVPVTVDGAGVHPAAVGSLPEGIAALLRVQAGVQQMAVEAAARGSKELALQALLIDPVVNSASAAEKILEELWEVNRQYIRAVL
jgi:alpha-galactosidase